MASEIRLDIEADGDGNATVTSERSLNGYLEMVEWVDGNLGDGVDFDLKEVERASGIDRTILNVDDANSDAIYRPRELVHGVEDGAALTGTQGGDRVRPYLVGKLQVVVSGASEGQTGALLAYVVDR